MATQAHEQLLYRGLWLEYLTLGWNVLGASLILVWNLTGSGIEPERKALRWIGLAFFAFAAYILAQSRTDGRPRGIAQKLIKFCKKNGAT
jgi:hypothetical protein